MATGFQFVCESLSHFQSPVTRLSVISWRCSCIPYWWLLVAVGCSQMLTSVEFQRLLYVSHPVDLQQVPQQKLLGCWSPTVEWPSTQTLVARSVFPCV